MYKIIGSDQLEYGPVSADEILKWISEKRVNGQTMVQQEGNAEWKPLSNCPEFATALGGNRSAPPISTDPRQSSPIMSAWEFENQILNGEIKVNIGNCMGRGWNLVKNHLGLAVGSTFLVILIGFIISIIPLIGSLLQAVFQGVLNGGLFWFYLKLIRGEEAEISNVFAGFKIEFVQLMLAGLVTSLLTGIAAVLAGLPFLFPVMMQMIHLGSEGVRNMGFSVTIVFGVILAVLVAISLSVLWMFTLPLVIDKRLGFWEAMELSRKVAMKRFFPLLGLIFISAFIAGMGVIVCCVGILITIPIAIAAITYAYEDIFGSQQAAQTA